MTVKNSREYRRSSLEVIFLCFFVPIVIIGYSIYKYPQFFVQRGWVDNVEILYLAGKSPSFWYALVYTLIVTYFGGKLLFKGHDPYRRGKARGISNYQRWKFISILASQWIFFFIIPFVIAPLAAGRPFWPDPLAPVNKDAYIYVSRGFTSLGGFFYIFILVPVTVYYFGKRYCSWFCSCGNLAETIGVTKWGSQWVKYKTPRGAFAKKMESLQTLFLTLGLIYGLILFLDLWKLFSSETLLMAGKNYQDFVVDFIFGALIGIAAYPFLGTRIWCRYGCPLAKGMELFGRVVKGRFEVVANDRCKGVDHCTQVCPMGIPVDSFAHKDKRPVEGTFGLDLTPCIGCGGCIDACPFDALSFKPIRIK